MHIDVKGWLLLAGLVAVFGLGLWTAIGWFLS